MDERRRSWLELLIAACERAAAHVDPHDPYHGDLIADILRLRTRCEAELDAQDPP